MLDFEDIYEETIQPIHRAIYKFRDRLKADRQDLEQELLIKIFKEIDKIEKVKNKSEDWQGYVYVMCLNYLKTLELEEHKQGLWLNNSYDEMCYLDGEYTDDRFVCQHIFNTGIDIKDHFLEWYYSHKKEYNKKWREEHPDYYKEYVAKNREHINELNNQWKKNHKEYVSLYNKIHREQNKEHYKEYREKNKEHIREIQKQWEERQSEEWKQKRKEYHNEYSKQYSKQYYQEHKDNPEYKEKRKQYYQEHKEKVREYKKQYYQENKKKINDKHNEYMKSYREKNREKMNAYNREYKKKRRQQLKET